MTQPVQPATTSHTRTRNKRMTPTFSHFSPIGRLAAMISLGLVGSVHAQQTLPSAGQLLQDVPQQPMSAPSSDLDLRMLHAPATGTSSDDRAFRVSRIVITGNTLLPTAALHRLVAGAEGRRQTLGDLYALADRIGEAYHRAGYPLARAYVPAQTLHQGVVTIAVIEARYGKVALQNRSKVAESPLQSTLAPLKPGQPVTNETLERSLLLLSDIPGAQVSSVVQPGAAPGTSDLVVDVTDAPRYTGTLGVDDFGNRYTGRARVTGDLSVNGLLHRGDLLDFSGVSSGGGMNYLQGGYRMLLNGQGTTLRVGLSSLRYHLGDDLRPLDAHGSAVVGSVALTQPFIRSTAGNLYGKIEFDHRLIKDDIEAAFLHNDRRANVWVATLAGDERDTHGVTNFNLSASRGKLTYTDALASLIDSITTRTAGSYGRYSASVSRLQRLDPTNTLYFGYTLQWASKNLDPSEEFFLGGPNTVRGYDTGALVGTQGNLFTAEFRHDFTVPHVPGSWQAALFADTGRVQVYKQRFVDTVNRARASSAGVGLHWVGSHQWMVNVSVSKPIGATPALLAQADTRTRYWVQLQKGFD